MGLLQNGFRDTLGAYQTFGATASNNAYPSRLWNNFARTGAIRNLTAGEGITDDKVSQPSGNRHPSAWMMPQKAGALAARNSLTGTGTVSNAEIWAVKLAEAMLTGSGTLSATGGLIVQLLAAIAGSGTVSAANMQAFLAAVANLTGSGGVTAATLTGIGELLADLLGDGALDASVLTAIGELSADLVVTGAGLTTSNVGQAVWSALSASNNAAGTMGEKLNDAGSASNPWTEIIESGYTAAEILRLIVAHAAGAASGLESGTPQFKSLDGTKTRIDGTYAAGERGITDLDPS